MNLCPKSIEVSESAGFCLGVARAVQRAFDEVELCDRSGRSIYMFGELIHNRQVISGLENAGVELAHEVKAIPDGSTVILRAHGVTGTDEAALEEKGCSIIDGTCAYVKRIHKLVEQTARSGEGLIITGRATHPEVEGIVSRYEALSSKRAIAPLKQAEDAVYVDTSKLNYRETLDRLEAIILEKKAEFDRGN